MAEITWETENKAIEIINRELVYTLHKHIEYTTKDIIINNKVTEAFVVSFIKENETNRELFEIERFITNRLLSQGLEPVKTYKDAWLGKLRVNICFKEIKGN